MRYNRQVTATILADLMPHADVRTYYATTIEAPVDRAYAAAGAVPLMGHATALWLLRLRALPARLDPHASTEDVATYALLRAEPGREAVFGFAGRFWHPSRNIARLPTADAWLRYAEEGSAKAAVNFLVEPLAGGRTRLSTETRVVCFGPHARKMFTLYWRLVGPFSGWIRLRWLVAVRRQALRAPGR